MIDALIGLAIVLMIGICFVLVFLLIREIDKQQPSNYQQLPAISKNGKQLQRVVAELRRNYPDRDERWYWDKAERELILRQTQAPPVSLAKFTPAKPSIASSQPDNISGLVNHQTAKKLFALTNGNRKLANRLLVKAREQNPQRSEQWCWEKVIYDLERDRRA